MDNTDSGPDTGSGNSTYGPGSDFNSTLHSGSESNSTLRSASGSNSTFGSGSGSNYTDSLGSGSGSGSGFMPSFGQNSSVLCVNITIVGDNTIENTEYINVSFTPVYDQVIFIGPSQAQVHIIDDDSK